MYDLDQKLFTSDVNTYEDCSSFNKYPSGIFEIVQNGDTLLISQNGRPCINTPRDNKGFSVEEFMSINFLQVKKHDQIKYTLKITNNNEIINENKLFVKTFPLITYDKVNKYFYCLINPTNQLLKFKIDDVSLEAVLEDEWELELPLYEQHVDYVLNNGIDRSLVDLNIEHNAELTTLKAVKGKIFILYRPGIPQGELENFKYNQHYLLHIYDIKTNKKITYALDYTKIFFLNCLDNGDMWFYHIEESERSKSISSVVYSVNIDDIFNNLSK